MPGPEREDYLASHSPAEVAAWYRRLADLADREFGRPSLAGQFMRQWLDNRDSTMTLVFDPPTYLRQSSIVNTVLEEHRDVYLTRKQVRIGGSLRDAGVVPRLRSGAWDGLNLLELHYTSLCAFGLGQVALMRVGVASAEDADINHSLHGFQLQSRVFVFGSGRGSPIALQLTGWRAKVKDRYDWNYSEHAMMPNPDFRSTASYAIRPDLRDLRVYHRNARRLEAAGLAAPYNIRSRTWIAARHDLIGPFAVTY